MLLRRGCPGRGLHWCCLGSRYAPIQLVQSCAPDRFSDSRLSFGTQLYGCAGGDAVRGGCRVRMRAAVPFQALSSSLLTGTLFSPPAHSYTNGAFCVPLPRGCITGGEHTLQLRPSCGCLKCTSWHCAAQLLHVLRSDGGGRVCCQRHQALRAAHGHERWGDRVAGCGLPLLLGKGSLPSLGASVLESFAGRPPCSPFVHTHFAAQARAPA